MSLTYFFVGKFPKLSLKDVQKDAFGDLSLLQRLQFAREN